MHSWRILEKQFNILFIPSFPSTARTLLTTISSRNVIHLSSNKERKERLLLLSLSKSTIILLFYFSFFFSSFFFFRAYLAPKSIKFVHGRLPKARQTRHARVEIELKSNGRRINESTNRCIRNAITEYKTSECFSRRINSFFPRIFIVLDPK